MNAGDEGERAKSAGLPKDDPLATAILALLAERPPGKSVTPEEVARNFAAGRAKPSDPADLWRRYLQGVREQAMCLARDGRIVILRKGKPADPRHRIKGVIRLALPEDPHPTTHGSIIGVVGWGRGLEPRRSEAEKS